MIDKQPSSMIPEKKPPLFKIKIEPALVSIMIVAFLAGVAFGYSLPKTRDIGLMSLPLSEETTDGGARLEEQIWQK